MTGTIPLKDMLDIQPQKNMSDKIYEQISQLIRSGELPEGYVFPNETVMCEQLKIGRSTIREAYKALELSGYVTRTKRGTVVNGTSAILSSMPLKKAVKDSSEEDFEEFRRMLEECTAGLAAERADEKEVEELTEIHRQFWEAYQNEQYNKMEELDKKFHEKIASATHNFLLITAMAAVSEAWAQGVSRNFKQMVETRPHHLKEVIQSHQRILDAVQGHDAQAAQKWMLDHISKIS